MAILMMRYANSTASFLFPIHFPPFSSGTCEQYTTQSDCLRTISLDQTDKLCSWDATTDQCSFNQNIGSSILANLTLTTMITLFVIPFDLLLIIMTLQVRNYFCINAARVYKDVDVDEEDNEGLDTSELSGLLDKKQKKRALLFRAARLRKMQDTIDNVSIERELDILQENLMNHQHSSSAQATKDRFSCMPTFIRNFFKFSHQVDASASGELLHQKVVMARRNGEKMIEQMKFLPSDASREHFLLRQFSITFLGEGRQRIASRFMQHPEKNSEKSLRLEFITYACLVILPLWFSMELFYIFLMGIRMGSGTTVPWLIGCGTSFLQQLIFLQPMKIWMKWTVLSKACYSDVTFLHAALKKYAKVIMLRTSGAMVEANSRIQHLNPACRAARAFPHLVRYFRVDYLYCCKYLVL